MFVHSGVTRGLLNEKPSQLQLLSCNYLTECVIDCYLTGEIVEDSIFTDLDDLRHRLAVEQIEQAEFTQKTTEEWLSHWMTPGSHSRDRFIQQSNARALLLYYALHFDDSRHLDALCQNSETIDAPMELISHRRPLHWIATGFFSSSLFEQIKQYKPLLSAVDADARNPVHLAAAHQQNILHEFIEYAKMTNQVASIRTPDGLGWFPVHYAAKIGWDDGVMALLSFHTYSDLKLMELAVQHLKIDTISAILAMSETLDLSTCLQFVVERNEANVLSTIAMHCSKSAISQALIQASQLGNGSLIEPLLAAGADQTSVNDQGNTAIEVAFYHGHFIIANQLNLQNKPIFESLAFESNSECQRKALTNRAKLYVNVKGLEFDLKQQAYKLGHPLALKFQLAEESVKCVLPLKKKSFEMLFPTDAIQSNANGFVSNQNLNLIVSLVSLVSDHPLAVHIISLSSLMGPVSGCLRPCDPRQNFDISFSSEYKKIGRLLLSTLIVTPHVRFATDSSPAQPLPSLSVIGHRGYGANKAFQHPHLLENTIASILAASEKGIQFVEFDIQLTKDLVPVLYHDWIVSESKMRISLNQFTLAEWRSLGKEKSVKCKTFEDLNTFKADSHIIRVPFCTLSELFDAVPERVGFNVEIKYPLAEEMTYFQLSMHHLNLYVDRILDIVYSSCQNRLLYFSSFHPDICLAVQQKQSRFPVFFLTSSGNENFVLVDERCRSLSAAKSFVLDHALDGIVADAKPLVKCPSLVSMIKKNFGRKLFTYGGVNNKSENIQLQKRVGVDAVIVDRVVEMNRSWNA